MAALSTGGREIAFQAAGEGTLWTVTPDNTGDDTGVEMAAGTSPAIVALPGGGYEIAFVNFDGFLRELGPDGVVRWAANGLGVAPGTSPAIAAAPLGGFEIAFQALTEDTLWTVTPDNIGHDTGNPMAAGSSPAVAGLTNGGVEVVFAGQDNYPRASAPAGTVGFVTAGLTVVWTMADDSTLRALGQCLDVGGTSIPVRIWDCNGTGARHGSSRPPTSSKTRNPVSA